MFISEVFPTLLSPRMITLSRTFLREVEAIVCGKEKASVARRAPCMETTKATRQRTPRKGRNNAAPRALVNTRHSHFST